jgi:hypothetical protein
LDLEGLAGGLDRFHVPASVLLQAEHQGPACHRLADHVGVGGKLVAGRGADEIRTVGIKAFLYQQVDLPEIHVPQVDRNLLRLACHNLSYTIPIPSNRMVDYA